MAKASTLFKRVRVGQKVRLIQRGGMRPDRHKPKAFVGKVIRKTGLSVEVQYRNKNGTWTVWLNNRMESSWSIWSNFKATSLK